MTPISFAVAEETSYAFLTLLESARKNIYISVPHFDWNKILKSQTGEKVVLYHAVKKAGERGVNVHILVGEEFLRSSRATTPPSRCTVRYVNRFGPKVKDEVIFWHFDHLISEWLPDKTSVALGEKSVYVHNQRYMLVDEDVAMIGAFDLSLQPNLSGMFAEQKMRHFPVCAFVKPNQELLQVIQLNWNSMGIATMPTQNRFFFGGRYETKTVPTHQKSNPEHSVILNMICGAKRSILIQTQYLSSHQNTSNIVAKALAMRLAKAFQDQDEFRCILLTNVNCSHDRRNLYQTHIPPHLTWQYMMQLLKHMGVPDPRVLQDTRRFFMGSVSNSHELTYIDGTVVIKDEESAFITSSGIYDYSLGPRRCSELGILVHDGEKNQVVASLFHQLLQDHLGLLDYKGNMSEQKSTEEYIAMCHKNAGRMKPFQVVAPTTLQMYVLADSTKNAVLGDFM